VCDTVVPEHPRVLALRFQSDSGHLNFTLPVPIQEEGEVGDIWVVSLTHSLAAKTIALHHTLNHTHTDRIDDPTIQAETVGGIERFRRLR